MKKNSHGWKTKGSKLIYRNRWLSLREYTIAYPNGRPGIYGIVEKGPGIAVIARNGKGEWMCLDCTEELEDARRRTISEKSGQDGARKRAG